MKTFHFLVSGCSLWATTVLTAGRLDCDESTRQMTLNLLKRTGMPAYDVTVRMTGSYEQDEKTPESQRQIRRAFEGNYRLATYGSPRVPGGRWQVDFGCEKMISLSGGGSFNGTENYTSRNTVTTLDTTCTKLNSISFQFDFASAAKFHGTVGAGLVGAQRGTGREYSDWEKRWSTHTSSEEARDGMSARFDQDNSRVEEKDGVYRITGQSTLNDGSGGNTSTEKLEWSITIAPLGEYEAFIEPVDETGFKEWLPLGPLMDPGATVSLDPYQPSHLHGNALHFVVKVYKTGEKDPVPLPYKTTFRLDDVSRNPGWCMNYPAQNPDQKPDLRFFSREQDAAMFQKLADDECTTIEAPAPVAVTVMSYDYGSHGRLSATVEMAGRHLEAHARLGNEAGALLLPFRTSTSVIANPWREAYDLQLVDDKADKDGFDSDIGSAHLGDGYSVYEEYRGFCEKGRHVRTDPRQRDYMVRNEVGAAAEDGIALFSAVAAIKVHHEFLAEEFGRQDPADGLPFNKVMNCNHDPAFHLGDQHGVVIRSTEEEGGAEAILRIPNDPAQWSPARFKYILIGADFQPGDWNTVKGELHPDGSFTVDPQGKSELKTNLFAMMVAHELFHTVGVRHHGEEDIAKVTWSVAPTDPAVILERGAGGSHPITLVNDLTGEPVFPADPLFGRLSGKTFWVGVEHGQHSGVEDCIMRYNNASAYGRGNVRYFMKNAEGVNHVEKEIAGIGLCDSPRGTGVNAPDFQPRPRYGDADAGRGNCRAQVCVSDNY